MPFFKYSEENRSQFDLVTQKQLAKLVQRFGSVEMREIVESKEWCVRVTAGVEGEELSLAALGDTAYDAAERLLRISQFREDI